MRFEFCKNEHLPKLAWLAHSSYSSELMHIVHGPNVEVRDHFFVEGSWDGDFESGRFDNTDNMIGTGGIIRDDAVIFVSAANTLDSLYYVEKDEFMVVSNSLPFLLAKLDDRLPAAYDKYDQFLDSVLDGISEYEKILDAEKHEINRLIYKNIKYDGSVISLQDKPLPQHFQTYDDYYIYVDKTYSRIVKNIRSPDRVIQPDIFSTQSRGYDTTAVNSIASKYGIDKAFTCTKSRDKNAFYKNERSGQDDDDGTDIAKVLGFPCVPIDRLCFVKDLENEELYYASHYKLADVNLLEVTRHVNEVAILLTGVRGEIWYGKEYYAAGYKSAGSDELKKFDMAGHGMGELRLHVGLILLPFPFIGARRQNDIHAITASDEMDPWRLEQVYDRPIPRRMAEQGGVPRDYFGQIKLNTTVSFPVPAVPFNSSLKNEYLDFLVEEGITSRLSCYLLPIIYIVNQWIYYATPNRFKYIYYLERLIQKTISSTFRLKLIKSRWIGAIYCFHVNKVAKDYWHAMNDAARK